MNEQSTIVISRFELGDMTALFLRDGERGKTGCILVPGVFADRADIDICRTDALVQLYIRGDRLPSDFINGFTLSGAQTTEGFVFEDQTVNETGGSLEIVTTMKEARGFRLLHRLVYREGDRAIKVSATFKNDSTEPAVLEYISSFTLGSLPPFGGERRADGMRIHRAKSWWSAEGRFVSETVEQLHLERSFCGVGTRTERFGQTGSMPVRRYFPFIAVEDEEDGITWAAQIACPSSWQIEMRRNGAGFFIDGGLADQEFGQWAKTVRPGGSFETPEAFITTVAGNADDAAQRLLDLHPGTGPSDGSLPVVFNEFCTSWGSPTEGTVSAAAEALKDRSVDSIVIDAGWYGEGSWDNVGDWYVNKNRMPNGILPAVEAIRNAGMTAGIWFEPETCTENSRLAKEHPEWLLTRHGTPINTGRRMFLNMEDPEVKAYLRENVIGFIRRNGIGYVKIDYNDCIGIGCDDPDGLGEGLRRNMLASQEFFRELRSENPGLIIECCSSGGHRLEPSMLALSDLASFSDAMECPEIPIIAANLQRLVRPSKSLIWAVIRKSDPLRRINYSLISTFLGVMCLSGDVNGLSEEQWERIGQAIAFYRRYSHIIRRGTSRFYGPGTQSYGEPTGWQAVARRVETTGETLITVHTFGGELPGHIRIPVHGTAIAEILCSEGNSVTLDGECLDVELKANFEAIAVVTEE